MFDYERQIILNEIICLIFIVLGYYLFFNFKTNFNLLYFIELSVWEIGIVVLIKDGFHGKTIIRYLLYSVIVLILMSIVKMVSFSYFKMGLKVLFEMIVNIIIITLIKRIMQILMNPKNVKVKYNYETYRVSLPIMVKVEYHKVHLIILRLLRNANRILTYLKYVGFVCICWLIFLFFICYVKNHTIEISVFLSECISNASSIFTSVVLVAFSTFYDQNKRYRDNLRIQYSLYYDFICNFDYYHRYLVRKLAGEEIDNYAFEDLDMHYLKDIENKLKDNLQKIKKQISKEKIIYWKENYETILDAVDVVDSIINETYDKRKISEEMITDNLYRIMNLISKPWTRDDEENEKILSLLSNQQNC